MKKKLIGILAVISIFTCMLVEVSAKTVEKTEEIANWTFDEETITYFKDSTTYPRVGKANYSGDNSLVDGYEGKGLAVNGAASSSQRSSEYYCFGTRVKTGNYRFTAKYKPGSGSADYFYMLPSPSQLNDRCKFDLSALDSDTWYDLILEVTQVQTQVTGTLTLKNNDEVLNFGTKTYNFGNTGTWGLSGVAFGQIVESGKTTGVVDNFYCCQILSTEIYELKEENVTITNKSGDKETDWTNVNPAVNAITVDFTKGMSEDTINEESVTLKAGETNIPCLYSYEGGILTLVPQSNLKGSTEYIISFSESIEYADGVTLDATEFTFKTAELDIGLSDISDYIYATDFNSEMEWLDDNFSKPGIRKWGGAAIVDAGYNGTKALAIATGEISNELRNININIGSKAVSTGTYSLTAKYKPSTLTNIIRISHVANGNGRDVTVTAPEGGFDRDKWYDLEVKVNVDTDTVVINILDGEDIVFTNTQTGVNTVFRSIIILQQRTSSDAKWNDDNTALIDDLKLKRVYTSEPVISKSNVGIYAANILQTDLANVSSLVERVEIMLSQQMKASTLTDENIYITKKSDQSTVSCTPMYDADNFSYTLFFDEPLTPGETYTIVVKDLVNVSDIAQTEIFTSDFTVGKAEIKATLAQITQNSTPITKFSELTFGEKAVVEIDYQNAKNVDMKLHLIVAYYDGEALVKAEYLTKDVSKDVKMATYKFDYTVASESDALGTDKIKVMLWDGFSSMTPLSDSLELAD